MMDDGRSMESKGKNIKRDAKKRSNDHINACI